MAENPENIEKDHKLPPRYEVLQIGLEVSRAELINRIETRVDEQIKSGLVDEVKELSKKYTWSLPAMSGIGYKQIGYYLRGELSLAEAVDLIKRDTRRYAKRQMTWFRRDKRIKWVAEPAQAESLVRQYI
jgi:tRNA dimethylallyltransferase